MAGLDPFNDYSNNYAPIKPAWAVLGKKKKTDIKEWFQTTKSSLEKLSEDRIQQYVNNILWYTGEYMQQPMFRGVVPGRTEQPLQKRVMPRIFNHLYDITEQRVSKLSRYKPSFDTVPTNRETKDYKVSRLIKVALHAFERRVQMDLLMQEAERWCAVCGEVLIGVEWNKDIGDRKSFRSVERIGDVDAYIKPPWTYFPEPKTCYQDVTWAMDLYKVMHIEEARALYPSAKLEPDKKKFIFEFNKDVDEKREDEVVVWRVVVPPHPQLPDGAIYTFINDQVVDEITDRYPYSHYTFPWERHTDLDVPGRLHGLSFYQQLKPLQNVYNRLTSIMVRNALLVGHPHVMMPKGAAKIEAFGNAPTVIEYTGNNAPQILTFGSVPQEFFQLRKEVKEEMGQISGIQGVSRGAPPSGSRSNSMLKFYEEQEEQRAGTQIIKRNEFTRCIYLKAGSIICDYYPTSSKERLIRVVGKENQYMIDSFVDTKLSTEYDVVIVNSTGFSESMSGRLEEIQLLLQVAPGILSPEQISDVLELKNPQKAYDISTAAIKQAEEENQNFLDGKDVPSPQPFQDLIIHWKTHMILFNSMTWESNVPVEDKKKAYAHMTATEMLMEMKMKDNMAFAKMLETLPGFPAFYNLEPPLPEEKPQAPQVPEGLGAIQSGGLSMPPGLSSPTSPPGASGPPPIPGMDVIAPIPNMPINGVAPL